MFCSSSRLLILVNCFCLSLDSQMLVQAAPGPPLSHLRSSHDLVCAENTLEQLMARLSLRLGVEPELEQFDWSVSESMFLHVNMITFLSSFM